ncbi:acetyltransferase (GNAT) family protein [Prauserella shujinwangii]|uniref:Acetyltransferase (GNAT) family protein n=1 Tax=Prauserella shujinwangii TaxID=1453103 RepID=A0A2T0LSR1_9PSEU|nr:GNAT family N-acetyltransferase [Prauserella shujinwangii]PRX46709.1 acetyltransferase (GNAT) family protein [Prauserella shujinwangii]
MDTGTDLVAAQADRFAAIDSLLPVAASPPDGETLVATLPDGRRVTGVLRRTDIDPAAPEALWSALRVWELTPLLGDGGTAEMDAVLRACRARLDRERPVTDSACVVAWPSRDVEATRALLDHGLVPLTALAVRGAGTAAGAGDPAVRIRRARPADVEPILRLERVEIEYSAQVGNLRPRPGSGERDRRRRTLRRRLADGEPVWLAELGGEPVGFADGGRTDVTPETSFGTMLPAGRWGQLHSVAVLPGVRGRGVGRALLAAAHAELDRDGARGTSLFYNPPNPLASVFWHRQGYRPLWTIWEVRPAALLR